MRELHLLGVAEDGSYVVLRGDDGDFRLPLDDALRAAVRWERRTSAPTPAAQDVRPRDVQAMIRAGASTEEVAQLTGWTPQKIGLFEGPVLAERAFMADQAGVAHVHGRGSHGPITLRERVTERLLDRGVDAEDTTWDSWRSEDGQWTVELSFAAGGRRRQASWLFTRASMTVVAVDDEARWLSDDESAGTQDTPFGAAEPRSARVFDVDAEGGLTPAQPPEPARDTTEPAPAPPRRQFGDSAHHLGARGDDELTASMRERSSARSRRRGSRRTQRESLPLPDGPATPVDLPADLAAPTEVPLAEITYDPETMAPPPGAHSDPDPDSVDGAPEPEALGYADDAASPAEPEGSQDSPADVAPDEAGEPVPDDPPVLDGQPVVEEPGEADHGPQEAQGADAHDSGAQDAEDAVAVRDARSVAGDGVEEPHLPLDPAAEADESSEGQTSLPPAQPSTPAPAPPKKAPAKRKGRASVPAWEDIMFGPKQ